MAQPDIDPDKNPKISGVSFRDGMEKLTSTLGAGTDERFYLSTYLSRNRAQLEQRYRASPMAGMIIDAVAEDMTRAGIILRSEKVSPNDIEELESSIVRMGIKDSFTKAIKWGRLYGGALAVIDIDGQDLGTPLRVSSVAKGQLRGVRIYDRWRLWPDVEDLVQGGVHDGKPRFYHVVESFYEGAEQPPISALKIHYSRAIRFIGIELPYWQMLQEFFWGESILERVDAALSAYDSALDGIDKLISRSYLRTVKVDGLRAVLASGGIAQQNLEKSFSLMARIQSNVGITLLDKQDEFQTNSYTFAGLSEAMREFAHQISASTGIPLVRLFGQSPAGLNSTGESDLRLYYDSIHAQQESRLRYGMHLILMVMFRHIFGETPPEDLNFDFTPLWQLSEEDKANVGVRIASIVNSYYESGIITQGQALNELKRSSAATGVFSTLKQEEIREAERDPIIPYSADVLKANKVKKDKVPNLKIPKESEDI